jgi:hypothetical protein
MQRRFIESIGSWSQVKKLPTHKLVVFGAAAAGAGAASLALFSTGVAGASPDQTGKSFSEAQATLKTAGYTPIVSIAVGDKTAQSDCKVIRQQDIPTAVSWVTSQTSSNGVFVGGDQPTLYPITLPNVPASGRVLLTLSCYAGSKIAAGQATGAGDITSKPSQ